MDEIVDLGYINKKSFYKMGGILFFIINVILLLGEVGVDIVTLLEVYYLIICLIALMLIYSRKKDEYELFFKEIAIVFFIVSFFNTYAIAFKGTEIYKYAFYKGMGYFGILKLVYIMLSLNFIVDRLSNKSNLKNNRLKVVFAIIAGTILSLTKYICKFKVPLLILVTIYALYVLNKIKYNKKDEENINYIKFYISSFFIRNIILLINIGFAEASWILDYLATVITFISCTMLTAYVIGKVLNTTYSKMKKKLKESLEEIEGLSIDLKDQNNQIQYRRTLINSREKTFKAFFRNIPVPTIMINSEQGNIVYVNKPGLEVFGEEKLGDMLGRNIMEFITMSEEKEFRSASNKAYMARVNKNNKKVGIESAEKRVQDGEEILLIMDLTHKIEYRNIEEIMKEKRMKEDMKRKFLSNISHDLKTPINVIYSSAQIQDIFIESENIDELEHHKKISKQNSFYLKRLANNIIDISKIDLGFLDKGSLEKDNIVLFIEDIFEGLVQYAENKNITMIFDTDEEEIFIKFSREYMERVILNIMSNAIKYNRKNGEILLYIKVEETKIHIIVKDNGRGIKKEFLENIFKRYTKESNSENKSMYKSSGIGMYVVKKLVEAQNGEIEINSEYGKGTEVVISFDREK